MTIISFRIDEKKKDRLDSLAAIQKRDRSYLINEALDSYLALVGWQIEHVSECIKQADSGNFATDAEASMAFSWQRA